MPAALDELVRIVTDADAPDGWKVRTKATVDLIERYLGLPLERQLAASGLGVLNGRHGHEDKAVENAQFVFWEPFELPAKRFANVKTLLERVDAAGEVSNVAEGNAYLALAVGHRWEHETKRPGYEGHVRWGFFLEAKEKKTDAAQPVLSGTKLTERVLRFGGAKDLRYIPKRPLPGINKRRADVGFWLSGLGRVVRAAELHAFGSLELLRDTIAKDLIALHGAISNQE